jgi:hypothetical protein
MQWLTLALLIVIAGSGLVCVSLLAKINAALSRIDGRMRNGNNLHHAHTRLKNVTTYIYRGGAWSICEQRLEPGFADGGPPLRPGAYEGEVVRRTAVRAG